MASRDRLGCVDVPALALQLLVKERPEWREKPVAVVAEDRPQGLILWVNERAYRARVLPGMRYAAGLSLCRELCAGTVEESTVEAGVESIADLLRDFSPYVEPSDAEPGVFWLDASGLERIEDSLESWGERLLAALEEDALVARLAVGFSRFGSYVLARTRQGVTVVPSPERERTMTAGVRLDRLHLAPRLRDRLDRLGVHTVGAFLQLPPDDLGRRFGAEALRLHRLASGALHRPLDPEIPEPNLEAWIELEHPETDATRLVFAIKRVLGSLLSRLADREQGLTLFRLEAKLDDGTRRSEKVRTAAPTLEEAWILELVRLRLESLELGAGIVELRIEAEGERVDSDQLDLFAERPRRDLSAASRAFARIRAEFGRLSVVWARLRRAHLPEARFSWEPLEEARLPVPRKVDERPLVRRLLDSPRPLPHRGHHEPDGWLVRGPEQGSMVRIHGPYTISGGWWVREVRRDYHFVETQKGDVMWVYYDRRRRRWFLHGQVE